MFHWKEKTDNVAYDYRRESKSRRYATARYLYTTEKPYSKEGLQISVSCWQMLLFKTNHTECHFQVARHLWSRHYSMMGQVPADGQRKRYVYLHLAVAYPRLLLSRLSPYAVWWWKCFLFFFSVALWDKNCCKCNLSSPTSIFHFWALPTLHIVLLNTWIFITGIQVFYAYGFTSKLKKKKIFCILIFLSKF